MAVLVNCKFDEDPIKSRYPPDDIFHILSLLKPRVRSNLRHKLMQPFPYPSKFDPDWPTCLSDIQV